MATIIKAAHGDNRGVVTFTTQERDQVILRDDRVKRQLADLKGRWIVGLHHNWHDDGFRYDPLFDFSMAGEGDLREAEGRPFPLIPMDACNFSPAVFKQGGEDKFWDVLFVARPVGFKGFDHLFETIRGLYDRNHLFRVLCIAPVPPEHQKDEISGNARASYESMFSGAERHRFTLLTLGFDYPFPFDLETLAHFYRSSRVFAHFAPDERRCRVAAYAWAAGLPVVGSSAVGSLLPAALQTEPFFFAVNQFREFGDRIIDAVEVARTAILDFDAPRRQVSVEFTRDALKLELSGRFPEIGTSAEGYALEGLDIRLGRHHGLDAGRNAIPFSVADLIDLLANREEMARDAVSSSEDPELRLAIKPEARMANKTRTADQSPSRFRRLLER